MTSEAWSLFELYILGEKLIASNEPNFRLNDIKISPMQNEYPIVYSFDPAHQWKTTTLVSP